MSFDVPKEMRSASRTQTTRREGELKVHPEKNHTKSSRKSDTGFGQILTGVFGPRVLGEEHPLLQFHRDGELQFYSSTGMGKQSMY